MVSSGAAPNWLFNKLTAKVRLNNSTIYREDYLYRKKQANDAKILKNYEEELRDPIEYFLWQKGIFIN